MKRRVFVSSALIVALTFAGCSTDAGASAANLDDWFAAPALAPGQILSASPEPVSFTEVPLVVSSDAIAAISDPNINLRRNRRTLPVEVIDDVVNEDPPAAVIAVDADVPVVEFDVLDVDALASTPVLERDEPFQSVAVTWPLDADDAPVLQARVRTLDGQWGDWFEFKDYGVSPDPGTEADLSARAGSVLVMVDDADAIQVATAAPADEALAADDVSLILIGSELPTVDAVAPAAVNAMFFGEPGLAFNASTRPAMITRDQWGASAQRCEFNTPAPIRGAVVHHTATNNTHTQAQAAQQIRNVQAFHQNPRGLGWCDIGYNFIVDRFGNLYEGRAGSMDQPVVGVHATGFNTGFIGLAFLGNFDDIPLPTVALEAAGQALGWRLAQAGVNPAGTVRHTITVTGTRFPRGSTQTLPTIMSHRDVSATVCPGRYIQPGGPQTGLMPRLRQIATATAAGLPVTAVREAEAVVRALYRDLLGRAVDSSGLVTWIDHLLAGNSQADLVNELTRSHEFIRLRVYRAYRDVLRRAPDAAGWSHWIAEIMAGRATVDDVSMHFFFSEEFFLQGGGTMEGFIRHLYRVMLGRNAAQAEVNWWAQHAATHGRRAAVEGIFLSLEAAGHRVHSYFQLFLGRRADASGIATWSNVMLRQSQGAVRIGIAGSPEYRTRAIARFGQ